MTQTVPAEEEGFEPPVACTTLDFKSSPFDRSGIPLIKGSLTDKVLPQWHVVK